MFQLDVVTQLLTFLLFSIAKISMACFMKRNFHGFWRPLETGGRDFYPYILLEIGSPEICKKVGLLELVK